MPVVVGVAFRPVTKIYYFDPAGYKDLQANDYVVVDTARGREIGQVVLTDQQVSNEEIEGQLKPVVRRASAWDMVQRDAWQHKEEEAAQICKEKVREYNLPMKIISAEYNFDGGRLVINFSSESRVDFRALVRDLAKIFHTRIEMKQIGARDESKILGGIGKCGRQLCCASWLREFHPVSIKMAKNQNLPLNPSEISGVCGKLLCCLSYEVETYAEARKRLPKVNAVVQTTYGNGVVKHVNLLQETVMVVLESEEIREMTAEELLTQTHKPKAGSCNGCAITKKVESGVSPKEAFAEHGIEATFEEDVEASGDGPDMEE